MKKKVISLLLACVMIFGICASVAADGATVAAKIGDVKFETLGAAIAPVATLNGDGKFYLDETFAGTAYDTEELAKAAVPTYQNGDGKFYLDAEFTTTGHDTEAEAQATAVVYQWTGEGADNKWYLTEEHTGEAYDSEELAKAAVPTYQNGDGKFYLDNAFEGTPYDTAAEAQATVPAFQNGDGKWHFGSDDMAFESEDNANNYVASNGIVLAADCTGAFDFASKTLTLDLNGYTLSGSVNNAADVTVTNSGAKQDCLAAIGTYANDVTAFVADGFDAAAGENGKYTVFSTTASGVYTVRIVTLVDNDLDRDKSNDGRVDNGDNTYGPLTSYENKNVDLFASDIVKAEVRVYGGRFVAADVKLKFDNENFELANLPATGWAPMDGELDTASTFRFQNAKSQTGTTSEYFVPDTTDSLDGTDNEPYYVLGTFEFAVKDSITEEYLNQPEHHTSVDVNGNPILKDEFNIVGDTYVAGAWFEGWSTDKANKIDPGKCLNDFANIRLRTMSASVTARTNIIYSGDAQNLFEDGYTAKDIATQTTINDATITYCVMTKADADGKLWSSAADGEQSETVPGYVKGYEPKQPVYVSGRPQATDAGTYAVYWKIAKPGYITVTGKEEVSIAKLDIQVTWASAAGDDLVPNVPAEAEIPEGIDRETIGLYTTWSEDGHLTPVATYYFKNQNRNATVTMTNPSGGTFKDVAEYEFTAFINDNFNVTSPTIKALINGGVIEGYTVANVDDNGDEVIDTEVWYDGENHTPAALSVLDSHNPDEVIKEYYVDHKDANGVKTTSGPLNEIPDCSAIGDYTVRLKLSADNFYTHEESVNFKIKGVEYEVEQFDYVFGWKLVLIYTNDSVPGFTYDGHMTYDVTRLGYKFGSEFNAEGETISGTGTAYTHVYGFLVYGSADTSKVVPSNLTAMSVDPADGETLNRFDVNQNNAADLNDLVAAQGTYNVDTSKFLNDEQLHIALKCDVTGNKKVDTSDMNMIKQQF